MADGSANHRAERRAPGDAPRRNQGAAKLTGRLPGQVPKQTRVFNLSRSVGGPDPQPFQSIRLLWIEAPPRSGFQFKIRITPLPKSRLNRSKRRQLEGAQTGMRWSAAEANANCRETSIMTCGERSRLNRGQAVFTDLP